MEEARVLARLDRIDALDREGAAPGELLAELRGLLRDAETWTRQQGGREQRAREQGEAALPTNGNEEVIGRLRTALARNILGG
jgi:hypothetical protein